MSFRTSTDVSIGGQCNSEWLEITPGERFRIRSSVIETEGRFTLLELVADSGNGVSMHIHKNEDEHFIVLEGTLHMANGDTRLDVRAGNAVTVERGVPHAWCNLGDQPLRMLIIFSPGNIERMFKEIATRNSDDEIAALADRFGCVIVGPPLHAGIRSVSSPRALKRQPGTAQEEQKK